MKEFTFMVCCDFCDGYVAETSIDVELTDKEAKRLIKYGTQYETYYDEFSRCEELQDIYKKVYDAAIKQMTKEIREFKNLDDECANDPNWKLDDFYPCSVAFPSEFELMLDEEE